MLDFCFLVCNNSAMKTVRNTRYYRRVAGKMLGRKLRAEEIVHHADGNYLNDAPHNLVVLNNATEHNTIHSKMNYVDKRLHPKLDYEKRLISYLERLSWFKLTRLGLSELAA